MTNTSSFPFAPAAAGPLAGLKVIELGQLIAGPFAARTLADFGAEVIKIEPPGAGDPLRTWRLLKDGTSVWWQVQSRNKRSLALDLRQAEAQGIVRQLAAEAPALHRAGAEVLDQHVSLGRQLPHDGLRFGLAQVERKRTLVARLHLPPDRGLSLIHI